jgi:plastocyanin
MNNYDGTNNTFVGYLADVNVDNPSPLYNNATALGYNAKVTGSNKIQLGDANILNVSTYGTITAGNVTYPKTHNTIANQVLTINASGVASWAGAATGIGGSGTASYIPKFNASTTTLGNSLIFDDGTSVMINTNTTALAGGAALLVSDGTNAAPVTTGTTQTGGALRIRGGDNTVIDFGTVSTKPWIQAGDLAGLGTNYPLYINPNGGNVAIGLGTASTTSSKLQVNGDVGATTFNNLAVKKVGTSIALGSGAPSVTGNDNISIGEGTLNSLTTAGQNIAIGYRSMYKTNTEENTAIGHLSMFENTGGRYNAAIGFKSGYDNTTGDYNTFLGYYATASSGNLTNATAIGNGAIVTASNTMQLGNTSVTSVKTNGAFNAPVYSSSPVALTAGSTITWAPMSGLNASVTLNANSTLSFGATPPAGSSGTLIVSQPASGSTYTLALPSAGTHRVLGSASGITLSTTNNAKDIVSFYYDGSIYYWNVGLGYGSAQSLSANSLTGGVAGAVPYQTATNTTGFTDAGTTGYFLTSQGTGKPTWTAPTTGIGGSGTASYIPRFNGSTTILGNSSLTDDGTGLRIGNSNGQSGIYTGLNSDNNTRLMVTGGREYESIKMSFPGDPYNNELSFNWYSTAWRLRTERSSGDITDLSFWRTAGGTTTEHMVLTSTGSLGIGIATPSEKLDVSGNIKTSGTIKAGVITYPNTAGTNGYILTTNGSNIASWTAPSFVDLSSAQTIGGVKTFSAASTVVNNNLTVNAAGTSGQGIVLSDDGDIVDNNDGAATFRFSGGVKINNGKQALGTTTAITLGNNGAITATGAITAPSIKLTSGASNGYILTSSADGTASWAASASSISGGTLNALPKYSSATAIAPSAISDDGTTVSLASTRTLTGANAAVNAQTGTTYTLVQGDNGRVITMNNASAITLTIPSNLTAGFNCMIVQYGVGTVTIAGSGVTVVNRSNYNKTGGQYAIVTIVSPVANTFITGGDMQ